MKLNTSNLGKFEEFKHLFAKHGRSLEATHVDLAEIEADPISVVVHKASQMEDRILVDDTSLEVAGAALGINVRWLLEHLPELAGRKASWRVLLAYRERDQVFVYQGIVIGTIVEPKGKGGFGFDPVFLPDGATQTLAEAKLDCYNARALAVDALLKEKALTIQPVIQHWQGPWQQS